MTEREQVRQGPSSTARAASHPCVQCQQHLLLVGGEERVPIRPDLAHVDLGAARQARLLAARPDLPVLATTATAKGPVTAYAAAQLGQATAPMTACASCAEPCPRRDSPPKGQYPAARPARGRRL